MLKFQRELNVESRILVTTIFRIWIKKITLLMTSALYQFPSYFDTFLKKIGWNGQRKKGVHVHVATSNDKTPLNDIKYLYRLLQGYTSSGDSGIEKKSVKTYNCFCFIVTWDYNLPISREKTLH